MPKTNKPPNDERIWFRINRKLKADLQKLEAERGENLSEEFRRFARQLNTTWRKQNEDATTKPAKAKRT